MPTGARSTYLLSPKEILLKPVEFGSLLKWQARPPAKAARPRPPVRASQPPPGGTRVQVRSFDLAEDFVGRKLPRAVERLTPDHAYVEYDDGREPIIASGGPSAPIDQAFGIPFVWEGVNGRLGVVGDVKPASRADNFGRGTKVLAETFLPGQTASQAAAPAKRFAEGVNRGQNLYGARTNSNSFANGAYEGSTGRRMGTSDTWGHETRLGDGPLPADFQRSRKLLGPGLGSTDLGRAITKVAEDVGGRLSSVPYMPGY